MLFEHLDQKGWYSSLEPVVFECLFIVQKQQNIKRIIYMVVHERIAVIPELDLIHVRAFKMLCKHCFQIVLGIAADGGKF